MKCRKCDEVAVINMRQHKLALCQEHFPLWFAEQTERAIEKYHMFTREEKVLVAVSGGKDSLALWDVLLRLGYQADGVYIDLGIEAGIAYSTQSRLKAAAFAAQHPESKLIVVDLKGDHGEAVPDVARRKRRSGGACSVCGLIKRHEMNRVALEGGYDVLATGHNLDDEAAVLFGNVMHWQTGYLRRQGPVLPADGEGLARKVKPFCRLYERETLAYVLVQGIDYIYDECPFSVGATSLAHKEILARMEADAPGSRLQFYLGFLRAREEEGLFGPAEEARPALHACSRCGQPTTAPEICSFCRLWDQGNSETEVAE